MRDDIDEPREITAVSGQYQHTIDLLHRAVAGATEAGMDAVDLSGVPARHDATGSQAWTEDGILNRGLIAMCAEVGDTLVMCANTCLDEFTNHGHCDLLDSERGADNDATLPLYQAMAISRACAGAHMVSSSGMMDGQVAAIRATPDQAGHADVAILVCSAEYAPTYLGPLREAIDFTLKDGRHTYQQDPTNRREGLPEALFDAAKGVDMLMIRPAGPYLNVLTGVVVTSDIPVAAYQVSSEYAMVGAAAVNGQIGRTHVIDKSLTDIFHVGVDSALTYQALEVARRTR